MHPGGYPYPGYGHYPYGKKKREKNDFNIGTHGRYQGP
jgi:hypothetical protein